MVAIRHYGVDGGENRVDDESEINVEQGDKLEFFLPSYTVNQLRKVGEDLKMTLSDAGLITVKGFFVRIRDDVDSSLIFSDTLFTATELLACFQANGGLVTSPKEVYAIHQQENEHLLRIDGRVEGSPKTRAYQDSAFLYRFKLEDNFSSECCVEVLFNGGPLPEWLKLEKIGLRNYILTGIPEQADVGDIDIQIQVSLSDEDD
jgi:hypothetical protein